MPIYEYVCDKCGNEFEELIMDNAIIPHCPDCGSKTTHRKMSVCARRARGSANQGDNYSAPSGGGCAGCSGGNCASCGR